MDVNECCHVLDSNPGVKMHWMLPDKAFVPAHYHITEVGKLETTKLAAIMRMARPLLESDELPVEIEYEEGMISQHPLGGMEVTPTGLLFYLGTKHTACLAPEKCQVGDTGCF